MNKKRVKSQITKRQKVKLLSLTSFASILYSQIGDNKGADSFECNANQNNNENKKKITNNSRLV